MGFGVSYEISRMTTEIEQPGIPPVELLRTAIKVAIMALWLWPGIMSPFGDIFAEPLVIE
jgi:hypothetical protein